MTTRELTQLVLFRTTLPVERFTTTWEPVAAGFLAAGLSTITLAQVGGNDGVAFVSRNTWPEADYRRAFPGGLASDGGGGAVSVAQAGVFVPDPRTGEPVSEARPNRELCLALLTLVDPAHPDAVISSLLAAMSDDPAHDVVTYRSLQAAQRYHVALTVHGSPGSGVETAAALDAATAADPRVADAVVLRGRELLSMAS